MTSRRPRQSAETQRWCARFWAARLRPRMAYTIQSEFRLQRSGAALSREDLVVALVCLLPTYPPGKYPHSCTTTEPSETAKKLPPPETIASVVPRFIDLSAESWTQSLSPGSRRNAATARWCAHFQAKGAEGLWDPRPYSGCRVFRLFCNCLETMVALLS